MHDGLAVPCDRTADFHHFARVLVDNRVDLSSGIQDVTDLEGLRTRHHLKAIRQMNQFQQISINGPWEDGLGNGLPTSNDSKVHRGKDLLAGAVNKGLTRVADGMDKIGDGLRRNGLAPASERRRDGSVERDVLVAEPAAVVEFFDAVIAITHHLPDGGISCLGVICEQEGQRNNTTLGGSALVQGQADLVLVVHLHLDCSDKLARLVRFPHDDGCLGWVGWMSDLNIHTRGGGNDPLHGVRLETVALNKNIGLEKSKAPGVRIAGQETQPTVEVGKVGCGGR